MIKKNYKEYKITIAHNKEEIDYLIYEPNFNLECHQIKNKIQDLKQLI